ncbi:hypothetical protein [Nocardia sp. NBC_00403]|uniref:hypothetical protein n=1 Tax=Nocardia sp. NBC_00403 TaxID=2975990 RepID=UPI002E22E9CF
MLSDLKEIFTDVKALMEPIGKVGAILASGSSLDRNSPGLPDLATFPSTPGAASGVLAVDARSRRMTVQAA